MFWMWLRELGERGWEDKDKRMVDPAAGRSAPVVGDKISCMKVQRQYFYRRTLIYVN